EDKAASDPSGCAYRVLDGDINDAEGGTLEIKHLWDSSSIITIEHYNRDFATHQGDGRIEIYAEVYGERGSDWVHNYIKSNAAAFGNEVGDPLVLDLDGNGYDLRSNTGSNVYFNIEGGEIAHRVGWVSGNDGFLVRDTNANGTIDDVSELFGNTNTSGFAQLAAYDNDNIPFIQHSKEYTQIVC
ncbi:MAG: hypothetical protein MK052_12415, partial [Alphaproteobacteria bacterium]|nr:hypothetical protein [Alphaproteobacteria bacterium]